MRFMVFDLPAQDGPFTERLAVLDALVASLRIPWLHAVRQFRVADHAALEAMLNEVVAKGGEGLVLHRASSLYRAGRSDDLLKYKPYQDDEARVVGHLPGNGKYEGILGALLVERGDGLRFRIGTGFTDEERRNPPPIGSWITYAYNGFTVSGIPRFARFMRISNDHPKRMSLRCSRRSEPGRQRVSEPRLARDSHPGDISVGSNQHGGGSRDRSDRRKLPGARVFGIDPLNPICPGSDVETAGLTEVEEHRPGAMEQGEDP
jgi:hypothetical protein